MVRELDWKGQRAQWALLVGCARRSLGSRFMKSHQPLNAAIRLSEKHRAELHASGIDDEMMMRAGVRTIADAEVAKILGWQPRAHHWGSG